jgi:membrane protein DedA with SNARE-associated domain
LPGPRSDRTTAPGTHPEASAAERGPWSGRNALVRFGYSRPGDGASLLAILNDLITGLIGDYGYLAVFVLMVLESACVPVPSEVTMLFGGALASAAFAGPGQELDLTTVALLGTAGNVVGSWLAYWAGAAGGRPLVHRFGRYLLVLPDEVDRAHDWFERRGELAVFVSRLLPVIRTFISLPAGVARMPFRRFIVYTFLGALPWVTGLTLLGVWVGENWETWEGRLKYFDYVVAVLLVGAVAFFVLRWRRGRSPGQPAGDAEPERELERQ